MFKFLLLVYMLQMWYTDGGKVTVCEGNRENLECLSNQTLVIKKAIYGRQSRLACASDCFDRNACTTEGWLANCAEEQETTSLIKNSCKASPCSLSMQTASDVEKIKGIFDILTINNINHTLPSNFVSVNKKYVEVEYLCVDKATTKPPSNVSKPIATVTPDPSLPIANETICEGKYTELQCGPGQKLKILSVFWGRRNIQTCISTFRRNNETECEQENFLPIAQNFCDGQRSCFIYAHKDWLGDPCPMYSKYLEITFQCSSPPTKTRTLCERKATTLFCPKTGYLLTILNATFGRTQNTGVSDCHTTTTIDKPCIFSGMNEVVYNCHDKKFCYVTAIPGKYGNPCAVGVTKYLNITYRCEKKEAPVKTTVKIPTVITATPYTPTATTASCGKRMIATSRIIKGEVAQRGAWPWQIAIYKKNLFHCGGAIISPIWAVSAAHCFEADDGKVARNYDVIVGETDRTIIESSERKHSIERIISYPNYDKTTINQDIALIKIKPPIFFGRYVQPACLPDEDVQQSGEGYLTGWGKNQYPGKFALTLQQAKLTIVGQAACRDKLAAAPGLQGKQITQYMFCVSSDKGSSGCHGDSGGPFVMKNGKNEWVLRGVVSWGSERCSSQDMYQVLTNVTTFKDWIARNIS